VGGGRGCWGWALERRNEAGETDRKWADCDPKSAVYGRARFAGGWARCSNQIAKLRRLCLILSGTAGLPAGAKPVRKIDSVT